MAKSKSAELFTGRWHITSMDQWDNEYLNVEGQPFIEFEPLQTGRFHFGYVQGEIDYRLTTRDGKPAVEFTWDGRDEMEPVQGRGWAVVEGDKLKGKIFFHLGDESGFVAKRADQDLKQKKR
jgi:hypothetical protein